MIMAMEEGQYDCLVCAPLQEGVGLDGYCAYVLGRPVALIPCVVGLPCSIPNPRLSRPQVDVWALGITTIEIGMCAPRRGICRNGQPFPKLARRV